MKPAVFLDRDGTLIIDKVFLANPDGVEVLPGVVYGLRRLQDAGYTLVIVTNQSGISRGFFTKAQAISVNDRVVELLDKEGIAIAGVYMCPHRPGDRCACRKPQPGLLLEAAEAHDIDLSASAMVGDKRTDAQAGRAAGCRLNIVLSRGKDGDFPTAPGLNHAADIILDA